MMMPTATMASLWTDPKDTSYPNVYDFIKTTKPASAICERLIIACDGKLWPFEGNWGELKSVSGLRDELWACLENIVIIVQRFDDVPTSEHLKQFYAANAAIASRIQRKAHIAEDEGHIGLGGPALHILITHDSLPTADFVMPAYQPAPVQGDDESIGGHNHIPLLVEVMEKLDEVYPKNPTYPPDACLETYPTTMDMLIARRPHVHFVSRSLSSLSPAPQGWSAFLHRFSSWASHMTLIYQLRSDWPSPDIDFPKDDPRRPAYAEDAVYSVKYLTMPLARFDKYIGPEAQPEEPKRWTTVKGWMVEEFSADTGAVPPEVAKKVKLNRGRNRLCF